MPASARISLSILTLVLISLIVVPARAQEKSSPPDKEKNPTTVTAARDYSKEAFVIEQVKRVYRFEKDGTGQNELSLRVRVQSDAALEHFGQLVLPYSSASEKLDIDFVRVRKADGSVVTASANDAQDLSAPIT